MPAAERFDFRTRNGVRLHCHAWGRGTHLVLGIHWLGGNGGEWHCLAEELELDQVRLVVPDLPGHGGSSREPSQVDTGALAAALLELAGFLEAKPFSVLGHSFGGKVAWRLAALAGTRVRGLGLLGAVGPAGVSIPRDVAEELFVRHCDLAALAEAFRPMFQTWPSPVLERYLLSFAATETWALRAMFSAAAWVDESTASPPIQCPALLLAGCGDPIYGPAYQRDAVQAHAPNGELLIVERCGHGLFLEQPKLVGASIRRFLKNLG